MLDYLKSFLHPKRYCSDTVDLLEEDKRDIGFGRSYDSVDYGIYLHNTNTRVGYCDLRIGMNKELYYAGNIGYRIEEQYRGNHYAYDACRILMYVARSRYHMKHMVITCSPENVPSRKTLEKLGGTFGGTVDVPRSHWLYARGEKVKNIYYYKL